MWSLQRRLEAKKSLKFGPKKLVLAWTEKGQVSLFGAKDFRFYGFHHSERLKVSATKSSRSYDFYIKVPNS